MIIRVLRGRIYTFIGLIILFLVGEGPWRSYRGLRWFFKTAQSEKPTILRNTLRYILRDSHVSELVRDYQFMEANINKTELSRDELELLMKDDEFGGIKEFAGYAAITLPDGGVETVPSQRRGLILPLIKEAIQEENSRKPVNRVIEIGTGNGDVLQYLSNEYPDVTFVGVDFSVTNAIKKHGAHGKIEFVKAYALHMLEDEALKGDIVFSSSTLMCTTPNELRRYFKALNKNRFSQIVLNEVTLAGYRQQNDDKIVSKYVHQHTWYHNYCGYLREAGYEPVDFKFFHYDHPLSDRPDIMISLIRARLEAPINEESAG